MLFNIGKYKTSAMFFHLRFSSSPCSNKILPKEILFVLLLLTVKYRLSPLYRLYDPNTIALISGHVENGEPLPSSMLQQLSLAQRHMTGYELCRELYLASLDLELHTS
jgi:hypothetical protein